MVGIETKSGSMECWKIASANGSEFSEDWVSAEAPRGPRDGTWALAGVWKAVDNPVGWGSGD